MCTLHGLPVGAALTGAKADERQVLLGILNDEALLSGRAGQIVIADENYYGHNFEGANAWRANSTDRRTYSEGSQL